MSEAVKAIKGVMYYMIVNKCVELVSLGVITPLIKRHTTLNPRVQKLIKLGTEVVAITITLLLLKRKGVFNNK